LLALVQFLMGFTTGRFPSLVLYKPFILPCGFNGTADHPNSDSCRIAPISADFPFPLNTLSLSFLHPFYECTLLPESHPPLFAPNSLSSGVLLLVSFPSWRGASFLVLLPSPVSELGLRPPRKLASLRAVFPFQYLSETAMQEPPCRFGLPWLHLLLSFFPPSLEEASKHSSVPSKLSPKGISACF